MGARPDKYVLVVALEPLKEGDDFLVSQWPLHLTIQPPFVMPERETAFYDAFGTFLQQEVSTSKLLVVSGENVKFGNKDVRLVNDGQQKWMNFHIKVGELIAAYGGTVQSRYTGQGYTPHVTYQNGRGLGDASEAVPAVQFVRRNAKRRIVEKVFNLDRVTYETAA